MRVFKPTYSSQYDHLYAEKDYGGECDLIQEVLLRSAATSLKSVLDVGCGTGSHSIELARRGYTVTGIDQSAAMIDVALEKSMALDSIRRPVFQRGDVRSFSTGSTYDLAIMMFAVVGYLTTNNDVLAGLRNIRCHLRPGSLFVCDFWYGPSVIATRPTDRLRVIEASGNRIIRASSTVLDTAKHTADVTFKLWTLQGTQVTSETTEAHSLRYFFPQEFALFLQSAGFELCSMTAFPSIDEELTEQTWNAFVVARAV